jgi:hypothetical protein
MTLLQNRPAEAPRECLVHTAVEEVTRPFPATGTRSEASLLLTLARKNHAKFRTRPQRIRRGECGRGGADICGLDSVFRDARVHFVSPRRDSTLKVAEFAEAGFLKDPEGFRASAATFALQHDVVGAI